MRIFRSRLLSFPVRPFKRGLLRIVGASLVRIYDMFLHSRAKVRQRPVPSRGSPGKERIQRAGRSFVAHVFPVREEAVPLGYERGISAVPRDRRRRFRGTRRHKLEVVKDLHQLKKLSQGPVRRPAGLNSPATRSSAGFVMREIQTGLHKPEGATKQRLTKVADNSVPVCFPNCASICLGSRVSFDLPLALAN